LSAVGLAENLPPAFTFARTSTEHAAEHLASARSDPSGCFRFAVSSRSSGAAAAGCSSADGSGSHDGLAGALDDG
jgi:hypothetical protein